MATSASQPEDGAKVEKGPEGELKKTISTMSSSSAETSTRKDDDKSTFRGPDSGSNKLYNVDELKKLKVHIEIKKPKPPPATSGGAIDPSSIAPVRRPVTPVSNIAKDQVSASKEPNDQDKEGVEGSSEEPQNKPVDLPEGKNKPVELTEGKNKPVLEDLKMVFPAKRKNNLSENYQFVRASKHQKRAERNVKEYDAVCYAMVKKLLRMDSTQAVYAESLMNKVLEMGLLDQLSSETAVTYKK